jgi:hypothetical protein
MPLAGTFDVLDLSETLRLLSRASCTGRLQLRSGALHATVVLIDGQAAGADVGSGNGGGEVLRNWRSLLDDICFEALRAGRGSFEYQPDESVEAAPGPKADLADVVAAGERRLAAWKEVEGVIPSFDAVPRLSESLRADQITVDQEHWRLLVSIDGRRNLSGLARRLGVDVLGLCQVLKPLVEDGAVVFEAFDRRPSPLPAVRLDRPAMRLDPERTPESEAEPDGPGPATEEAAETVAPPHQDGDAPTSRRGLSRIRVSRSHGASSRPAGAAQG